MKKINIIGGGLGGLVSAILLARRGLEVALFEKKQYPFHRVCGEYISNEVKDFLKREHLFPSDFELPEISQFLYSSTKGRTYEMSLDLGAFGVSRYYFDQFLAEKATSAGVKLHTGTTVQSIQYKEDYFEMIDNKGISHSSAYVIGAFGKRSIIDKKLQRSFLNKKSPYIGVKYHLKTDFPKDLIALHNFESGYCGISAIENDRFNLCYLGNREILKKHGTIADMEENVLKKNPFLREVFDNSEFLLEKPEVINAFSFAPKKAVDHHIFMVGDAAGLITPLCGNGMAMAIHSAKILSDILINEHERSKMETLYTQEWTRLFSKRLWVGRQTQKLFGKNSSEYVVTMMNKVPFIASKIMSNTHGQVF